MFIRSVFAATDFVRASFSEADSSNSWTVSAPLAVSFTGTPTNAPLTPNWPWSSTEHGNTRP